MQRCELISLTAGISVLAKRGNAGRRACPAIASN
jgi:hypothetical protein